MTRRSQYPQELRDRAVRMVAEVTPDYESQWAAIKSVALMAGDRFGGDGAQVGPPGRGRRRPAAREHERGVRGAQAAASGVRRAAAGQQDGRHNTGSSLRK